jgi:membrane-anchored protein YejM (alkaline phosphatase superfamily)
MLWSGLGPDNDFKTMHEAPVLWEIARAVGYHTAYVTSQNLRYDDFSAFVKNAGIEVTVTAAELGGAPDPHVGAPDENATARMLEYIRNAPPDGPYFAVLHLSNTHWPYRVDPAMQPFEPHDDAAFGEVTKLHNHYRNSVLFQERTVSQFLEAMRALPSWDDTAVVFLSDHGEEFREHGGLYHLTTLYDEQVRIPGFLFAGPHVVTDEQKDALARWAFRRTFSQDVHATLLDLLGVFDQHGTFPLASRVLGRSLLRPPEALDPIVLMSTASGVWEPDDAKYGAISGDILAVRSAAPGWLCYDARIDPAERWLQPPARCAPLVDAASRAFAGQWKD